MAYIERAITPVLKKRVSDNKCLQLTGAGQVGKSTLVKHVFTEYHRADFDDRLTRLHKNGLGRTIQVFRGALSVYDPVRSIMPGSSMRLP